MVKQRNLFHELFAGKFSYLQKYYIVCSFFLIPFIIIIYFMIHAMNTDLRLLETQAAGNRYQKPVSKLAEDIFNHHLLNHQYLVGKLSKHKGEMLATEAQVDEDFRKLENFNKDIQSELFTHLDENFPKNKEFLHPVDLMRKWDAIKRQSLNLTPQEATKMHQDLIVDLRTWTEYLTYSYNHLMDPKLSGLPAIENTLIRLYDARDLFAQINDLGYEVLHNKNIDQKQKLQLNIYLALLKSNLNSMKNEIKRANFVKSSFVNTQDEESSFDESFNSYLIAAENFINVNENHILNTNNYDYSIEEYNHEGSKALHAGFAFWNSVTTYRGEILEDAERKIIHLRNWVVILSSILVLIGFFLGQYYIKGEINAIENLDDATRLLNSGDLTARVKIIKDDEIGRACRRFNQMADSFERMITQLRELLDAIKRLAAGDFSARVSTESKLDDDMAQVAYSFNNMAQSFEEIISQLHQLGINLTTSATEISAASKQQETIIIEQEATTREISVTANEISTTAKEFATTVSEVSKVAEHTSTLASTGKESLGNMENIMRQMVNASSNIASKLAVLNEKAGNITSVITTITKVADQTNLLSLNAAIEAEKAGEYGRSFAVIAREIRRLADQTALATLDIEKIVNEIMSAVSSSVMGVDDFTQEIRNGVSHVSHVGGQLTTIMGQVQALTQRFETVNQGMQTQSAAAEQINDAMSQLSQTARTTTESIHQFRNTIQQLNAAATDLRVTASKMKH